MAHNFKYFIIVSPHLKYEFLSDIKFVWFNRVKPGRTIFKDDMFYTWLQPSGTMT